ncbi:STAS domain-containing protein [Streptomyces radiopugnans]|uniref:STAS domain-containing protein n=1 Tax=Streptomyces radiopugnans TaxID=403935 RepID=UPI003F1A39F4
MTDVTGDIPLSIEQIQDSLAVAAVTGDVDLRTASALRARALEVVRQGQPHLVLDLADVGFCDSAGLSALIGIWHAARNADGSLSLAAVPARLMRMLAVTGADTLLPVHPSVADALAARSTGPTAGAS